MIVSKTGIIPSLLIVGGFSAAEAEQGPELPCVDCPEFQILEPYPAGGIWYNPEQSGTGFILQVQDGQLAGFYFLYDEDGRATWHLIVGTLEPDEDGDAQWVVEAELETLEGGACLNCPFQPPVVLEPAGTIRLEFVYRNYGRFSVDDGPVQNIVPLIYGVGGWALFEPQTDYLFPQVDPHTWAFVFRRQSGTGFMHGFLPVEFGNVLDDEEAVLKLTFGALLHGELVAVWGEMKCFSDAETGPICELVFDPDQTGDFIHEAFTSQPYILLPGNIGHSRFEAESADGRATLTGFRMGAGLRVNYD